MQQTEILIIGGGIAGVATAYFLTQQGHKVTLLERGELASEASGLNAGTIWAIGWGYQPDLYATLSMGGLDILKMLQIDLGYPLSFRQSGAIKAIRTEEEYGFAEQLIQQRTRDGYRLELLTSPDARSIEPELSRNILGCLHYPYGSQADPVRTVLVLASQARQHGAIILTRCEVTGIEVLDSGSYQVVTATETFKAATLVLAAGPWCRQLGILLGLNIPVFAVRGQLWITDPVPPSLFHCIGALEADLYWHKSPYSDEQTPLEMTHRGLQRVTRHLYGRQNAKGEIIVGGDRQAGVDKVPDMVGIEQNRRHAIEIFPFLHAHAIRRIYVGWMPFTRELRPIIGPLPGFEHLYVLTGLGSSGFEYGPMAGKLLAEAIHSGTVPPILAEADPALQVTHGA